MSALAKGDTEDGFVNGTSLLVKGCEAPVKAGLLGVHRKCPLAGTTDHAALDDQVNSFMALVYMCCIF